MRSRVPETENFGKQNADKERQWKGLRDALRIDGSQFVKLYEKMQALIADLESTVTSLVSALTYTRSQIDSKIASPGDINPGTVTASGQLKALDVATFNITGPRLTVWVETATGRLGNTGSTRRVKMNERDPEIDPTAVLSVAPRMFNYIAEVRKRDDPTFEGYVGSDYVVADEIGLMAEDLHDAGLGHLVYYEDVGGQMLPAGVDYVMWSVTLHVAVRAVWERQDALEARLDAAGL